MNNNDSKIKNVTIKDVRGKPVEIRENQIAKLATMRQASWYMLALLMYAVCSLVGFGIAYFVVRLLIYLQLQ